MLSLSQVPFHNIASRDSIVQKEDERPTPIVEGGPLTLFSWKVPSQKGSRDTFLKLCDRDSRT